MNLRNSFRYRSADPSGLRDAILFALALPKNLRPDLGRAWFFAPVRLCKRACTASLMQKTLGICRGFL